MKLEAEIKSIKPMSPRERAVVNLLFTASSKVRKLTAVNLKKSVESTINEKLPSKSVVMPFFPLTAVTDTPLNAIPLLSRT